MNLRNCFDSARHRVLNDASHVGPKRAAATDPMPPPQNQRFAAQKLVQPPPPMPFNPFSCPPPFAGYMGIPPGMYLKDIFNNMA